MTNKELQERYESLKEELSDLKSERIKAETVLESLEDRKEEVEKKIMKLASTDSIEDAKKKLEKVENKLDELLEKAEEILEDDE